MKTMFAIVASAVGLAACNPQPTTYVDQQPVQSYTPAYAPAPVIVHQPTVVHHVVHAPVYVAPRRVYVAPRPVYVAPRPAYVAPRPVYSAPARSSSYSSSGFNLSKRR